MTDRDADRAADAANSAGGGIDDEAEPSRPGDLAASSHAAEDNLEGLLHFLRDARGFDFTGYKRSTLGRRIKKRMHDVGLEDFVDYRDRLESDPDEFRSLFNTILINVTGFFRDPEVWSYLQHDVLPELIANQERSEIRIWSAGCSSGEEAYSLVMVLAELLGVAECMERVKVYGTDVDEEALREARAGLYPAKALEPVSQELRERYFEVSGSQFAFRSDLRRRVIFGRHDITTDAPISRLDLLVCRNTLMYFNAEAQADIIDRFHFALNDGGYLVLGKAEMLLSDGERFEIANLRQRLFRRRSGYAGPPHHFAPAKVEPIGGPAVRTARRRQHVRELMIESAPYATVGVDLDGTVTTISSKARAHFGLTVRDVGRPFHDLELSYRPAELRSLINQAHAERRTTRMEAVEWHLSADETRFVDIVIQPLWGSDGAAAGTSVSFLDSTKENHLRQELKRVREDLEAAYEELQSTNEELETTNEELQSSVEELETTNEELQSTNEELETTNEELQSGNEELETMNDEMRIRTGELDELRIFLEGVLSSIAAGVVVLDAELRVRSWNRGAEDMWGLRAREVHREGFFSLDFGLPTAPLREMVDECVASRQRLGPVNVVSMNRFGRTITCSVFCSPLGQEGGGVVLLMEETQQS
jgi:two-component system, chemotaxis family, CheB/CheR fusion protein